MSSPASRVPWRDVLVSFAVSRGVILALGVIAAATFLDQHTLSVAGPAALNPATVWQKWDAVWYERVALHGYAWQADDLKGQAVGGYFPLYPLIVALLLRVLPHASFFWTGAFISNVLSIAALALITSELTTGVAHARRVLLLMMTAAGSFYLSIPYTEALFVLLVVLTLIATRRKRYLLAAVLAGLSAVTRAQGVALIAVPAIACLTDEARPLSARLARIVLMGVLFAIPLAIYMAYLARVQGTALAFMERQSLWGNTTPFPFRAVVGLMQFPQRVTAWVHGLFWALYVALLARAWRRLPLGEALFCAAFLIISTQHDTFMAMYRYVIALVPLTLALADDQPRVQYALIGINLVVGTLMILAFVTNNRLAV